MGRKNIFDSIENKLLPEEIKKKGEEMAEAYTRLYIIENTLRSFINETLKNSLGSEYWSKNVVSHTVKNSVAARKANQNKNAWLPLRSDSDIYYTDLSDLADLISNNWNHFKPFFPDQAWIVSKIKDLNHVRNLIAHNSYISHDENQLLEVYFKSILKQIRALTSSFVDDKTKLADNHQGQFIDGLNKYSVYTYEEMNRGIEFIFDYSKYNVAPIFLQCFFNQSGLSYYMVFKEARVWISSLLATDLEIAEFDEINTYKSNCIYQVGQYDIDEDGVDEVFIAIQDSTEGAVQINILKYYPPELEKHAGRIENWESIGKLKAEHILGAPKVYIQKNSIYVPRNLRGLYHEWTWAKNGFVETGFW